MPCMHQHLPGDRCGRVRPQAAGRRPERAASHGDHPPHALDAPRGASHLLAPSHSPATTTDRPLAPRGRVQVDLMARHGRWAAVQQGCLGVLFTVTFGTDAAALGRKQRAFAAGALAAVVEAMEVHEGRVAVLQWGCRALLNLSYGSDGLAMQRKYAAGH